MRTPEGSVQVRAGETGICATNSRFEFHYSRGQSSVASWCEGFLPHIPSDAFDSMNKSYPPIQTPERLGNLLKIGVDLGHDSLPTLNAMRDAIGAAVIRTFLHEAAWSNKDIALPRSILKVRRIIEDGLGNETLNIAVIAETMGIAQQHLISSFKRHIGTTPSRYLWKLRAERARTMLVHSRKSQAEIAHQCGFKSQSHFARSIKKQFGMTPGDLRRDMGYSITSDMAEHVPETYF